MSDNPVITSGELLKRFIRSQGLTNRSFERSVGFKERYIDSKLNGEITKMETIKPIVLKYPETLFDIFFPELKDEFVNKEQTMGIVRTVEQLSGLVKSNALSIKEIEEAIRNK